MDKSTARITGFTFAKRIVDYYGTNQEQGAGDVLLEKLENQWQDWFVRYDSFYLNPEGTERETRFDLIIRDICALYNTRGGVVMIEINGRDPRQILKSKGGQDYAKDSCEQMCKHNTLLRTKDERKRLRKIFEAKVICYKGRYAIALLVKSADVGFRYPIGNDENHYFVRDESVKGTRKATAVITANSAISECWQREDYLNRDDLKQKLIALDIPVGPPKFVPFLTVVRNAFIRKYTAKDIFAIMTRISRLGFVVMTLVQFLPISYEVCLSDGGLNIGSALKIFAIGLIPFVAPYWAAQGTVHAHGMAVGVSYLMFFWPYILYACVCLFTAVDLIVVKRETVVRVGKFIVLLCIVLSIVGICRGYVAYENRIRAIGGYVTSSEEVDSAIGMNDLVVRSVEAAELAVCKKFNEMQPRDIYGVINRADYLKRLEYLQMLKKELSRVETMYMPQGKRRTKLVETLGGPDQGLIECLSALSDAINECIAQPTQRVRTEDVSTKISFDKAWQKVNLWNRRFFDRAKELGIRNAGN